MKIGVDAGCLGIADPRLQVGVWQVVYNLLCQLGKLDSQNQYFLYSFSPIPAFIMARFGPKMKNLVVRPAFGWNYLGLPLSLSFRRPDVFLGPSQSLPFFCPCPAVTIIHDLAFEIFPQFYPDSYRQLRRITRLAVRKAQKIIAVSRSTKKDLIRFYHLPAEKITVIYEGCDSVMFKPARLPIKPYFLFVGALKRVKNIPGLLQGFRCFLNQGQPDFKLLLAGGNLWPDPAIGPTIEKLGLSEQVEILGYLPTAKLVRLYQRATAFVAPSFYEGFGLPFLEAMACGCPVIGGRVGSIPEVVGQAGLLVDPNNPVELGQAMLKLANETTFHSRLSCAGLARADRFSWPCFAQQVLNLLTESK